MLLGDLERGLELIYEDILWEGRRSKMWDELNAELLQEAKVDDESEKD